MRTGWALLRGLVAFIDESALVALPEDLFKFDVSHHMRVSALCHLGRGDEALYLIKCAKYSFQDDFSSLNQPLLNWYFPSTWTCSQTTGVGALVFFSKSP